MLFCASFMPCAKPIALGRHDLRLAEKTVDEGRAPQIAQTPFRLANHASNAYSAAHQQEAQRETQQRRYHHRHDHFGNHALPAHQCAPCAQITASRRPPDAEIAAPTSEPTSAWLELDGKPSHHVIRFHTMAASRAQISNCGPASITPVLTMPRGDSRRHSGAPQRADHVGDRSQQHRLSRRRAPWWPLPWRWSWRCRGNR